MRAKLLLILLGAVLTACGGGGMTISFDPAITTPTTLLSSDGRITAVIPTGAVSVKSRLTLLNLTSADAKVPGPAGRSLVAAVELTAEAVPEETETTTGSSGGTGTGTGTGTGDGAGSQPAEPTPPELVAAVEITVQLAAALLAGASLPVYLYNANSARYEEAGLSATVSADGLKAVFTIQDFGRYGVFGPTADELPPPTPHGLTLLAASTQVRKLRWTVLSGADIAGYNLYRAPEGQDSFAKVNPDTLTVTTYSDELPGPGAFRYRLTAVGVNGLESEPGEIVESPAIEFDLLFTFGEDVLAAPTVLALNPATGLLVACDPSLDRLSVFNLDGQLVRHLRSYGSFDVLDPRGLAFSADGQQLYVTDAGYSVCFILDAQYMVAGAFGNPGTLAGQFLEPTGVAVLGDRVLVADAQRGEIQAFTPLGVYLRLVARPGVAEGEFAGPTYMLRADTGGLWVSDTGNGRVQGLAADYAFESLLQLDIADGGPLLSPTGLAQDFRGQVYVSDAGHHRVVVFDESGKFGFHFGAHGSRIIEFSQSTGPAGMALDRSTGYLYVSDPGNHRIAVFKS